jgi:hypothetical protein
VQRSGFENREQHPVEVSLELSARHKQTAYT